MSEVKKPLKITVHIEEEHECGQVHEAIYHMKQVQITMPRNLLRVDDARLDIFDLRPMELTGQYGKVDMNGIEVRENALICKKCGKNISLDEVKV
jgi:hypothetical protein